MITTVTEGRVPIFEDFSLARTTILVLREQESTKRVSTQAFVLMPDHLHWLFVLNSGTLSDIVKCFKAHSAMAINQILGRRGSVWQKSFFDHGLRKEEELLPMARYIVANPLRAGLAEHIGDYPHWDAIWLQHSLQAK